MPVLVCGPPKVSQKSLFTLWFFCVTTQQQGYLLLMDRASAFESQKISGQDQWHGRLTIMYNLFAVWHMVLTKKSGDAGALSLGMGPD